MKKVIALALTLALSLSLAACGKTDAPAKPDATPEAAATYKTGVGAVISAKPVAATADKDGSLQINTTLVAATFDAEGKIVSATIDVAQQKGSFDAKGQIVGEVDLRTKNEKGDDYGMRKASAIKKEVNEQHEALAAWMVGKTVEEVKAMKTFKKDDNHIAVPEEEDLKASVTITVQDYIAALEVAAKNAKETTGVVAKTGLGTVISAKPVAATADKDGSLQINTTFVVAAFDAEGKIVAATIDVAQQKGAFDAKGQIVGEVDLRTKNEKGDDYGMRKASAIKKEVNEQHEALAAWMIGKTAEEVKAMKTFKKDDDHIAVPEVEDLKASVTITVQDYLAALEKAAAAAK